MEESTTSSAENITGNIFCKYRNKQYRWYKFGKEKGTYSLQEVPIYRRKENKSSEGI